MRKVIDAISFKDGKILVVKKKDIWILPGGKPEEGEDDIECLLRECKEELPDSQFIITKKYKEFIGQTPHTGDIIITKTYFAKVSGSIKPSAEISEANFISKEDISSIPLSDITSQIIESLIEDKIFL